MIRIRHSTSPCAELEIEGSNSEWAELRAAVLDFCKAGEPVLDLPADSEFDPSPYQHKLARLRLHKTSEPLLISIAGDELSISGKPELLGLCAENMPYDAQHTSSVGYHVHFDRFGREDHISETSLGVVLRLRQ